MVKLVKMVLLMVLNLKMSLMLGYLEFRIKMRQLMNLIIGLTYNWIRQMRYDEGDNPADERKTKTIINMEQFNYLTTAV